MRLNPLQVVHKSHSWFRALSTNREIDQGWCHANTCRKLNFITQFSTNQRNMTGVHWKLKRPCKCCGELSALLSQMCMMYKSSQNMSSSIKDQTNARDRADTTHADANLYMCDTKDIETRCMWKGPILCRQMHAQRTNPILRPGHLCMSRSPIEWVYSYCSIASDRDILRVAVVRSICMTTWSGRSMVRMHTCSYHICLSDVIAE